MRICGLIAFWTAALVVVGCDHPEVEKRPRIWTLFDMQDALHAGGGTIAEGTSLPGGIPVDDLLTTGPDGRDTVKVQAAYAEGQPAGIVMTDVWANYDEVWIQPGYWLVTAWDEQSPMMNRLKDAENQNTPPLVDVGPDSTFYSPFWIMFYVQVPQGTPPEKYTWTKQLFDDRLPLFPGPPVTWPFRPASLSLEGLVHPILGTPVGIIADGGPTWLNGEVVPYIRMGSNNFAWDENGVVEELPLFVLVKWDENGTLARMDVPYVAGSSPLFARRPARVVGNRPLFGAFSRIYLAVVPLAGGAFHPDQYPDAAAKLEAAMVNPKTYQGRVATNATCFNSMTFPMACVWLDSQKEIEDRLGAIGIKKTELLTSAPLVFYNGAAIQ